MNIIETVVLVMYYIAGIMAGIVVILVFYGMIISMINDIRDVKSEKP